MKVRFQQQSEHSECGLACTAMLIDFFAERTNLSSLRKEYGVPNGGYNIAQIKEILENKKIYSRVVKCTFNKINLIPRPFIAFWDNKHFIIVEKISKNNILIVDPAMGKRKVSNTEFKKYFSEVVLFSTNTKKRYLRKIKLDKNILEVLKNNKSILFNTLIITLATQFLVIFIPYIIKKIIDSKVLTSNLYIITIIIVPIFYFIINMLKIRIMTNLQTEFDRDFLSKTIRHMLDLPYSYFANRSKGELIYRINSNSYIRQFLTEEIISLAVNILFFFIYLFYMFILNSLMAVITIAISILSCYFSAISANLNKKILQNEMIVLTKSQNIINEMVSNIFTIKSINSQNIIFKKWLENFDKQIKIEKLKSKNVSIFENISQTIQIIYPLIIFIIGHILVDYNKITFGSVIAFSMVGGYFLTPLLSIMDSYNRLLMVKVYIDRLLDILDTQKESDILIGDRLDNFSGKIYLDNVSYRYSYFSDNAISNITLKIEENEKVAIVGSSGSGKSTLLKVMSCLYQPTYGDIFYDNKNLKNIDISSLRNYIGVVLQENVLFSGTFKENITMGRNFTDDEIWDVLNHVNLLELVTSFSIGLETNISENGQNFSGGQRQKISIARTIISKPKAIFLDEPTSSLDNLSEKIIIDYLFSICATIVVVSHRLSTIKNFDKIVVMDKGKIVGVGTHEYLLENNIYYKKLYDKNTII